MLNILKNCLAIETEYGTDYVPLSSIIAIREQDATEKRGVAYEIKLIDGESYDLTEYFETPVWMTNSNLRIFEQLHQEESE